MASTKSEILSTADNRIRLMVKAVPGASRTELAGIKDGCLRIRIAAAPEDGKANAELIAYLAKTLHCAKRDILVESGEKARIKRISFPVELTASVQGLLNQ